MSQIEVKFDHQLKLSDIIIPLTHSSKEEAEEIYEDNKQEVQQTSIYGIQSPLIMINNIVVDFSDVISFNLKMADKIPEVSLLIRDRRRLISSLNTPGIDNELRIQILPKFDDKYKKINLSFYITKFNSQNDFIDIKGSFKLSPFTSSNIKSFGELNTYQLFEKIAIETGLGFASNVESNDIDKRYIYCDNKSYQDILSREINKSGSDLQIYDYWIDWWNNLTLVDIYERYNTIDPDDKIQLWVAGQNKEIEEGLKVRPQLVPAILNNHPANRVTELYVENYAIINSPGSQMYSGTDHVYSVYEENKKEYLDYLIQDGDTHKDVFNKFEYVGEVYGEYNYFLSAKKRKSFLQKMQSNEEIQITLRTPLLGILRGNKVNFVWYVNDSLSQNQQKVLEKNEFVKPAVSNIPLDEQLPNDEETKSNDGEFIIDKSISGQYLVTRCEIDYNNFKWSYKINLSRPTSDKPQLINEKNE